MEIGTQGFNAVDGLKDVYQSIRHSASKIASTEAIQTAFAQEAEIVKMKQSELNFLSVAKVLKAEDDIMGILLDEKV